jgi:DNA invertase Pin-like site-specific DNA recombinase
VRQSTIHQVLEHQESTKRQYALKQRAESLGWPRESLVVIDDDQGESAAYEGRYGFEHLVQEVSMGRAGIVLGLEVSRLSRNNSDWNRLMEICTITDTLILDEEGIYNPGYFNDRLLLGLKGVLSEAELHVIRSRLVGGMEHKAKRGELKIRLPVGLVYDNSNKTILDPDEEIQASLNTFFGTFRQIGTCFGTVKYLNQKGFLFPTRLHDGPYKGDVVWQPLLQGRAYAILRNPRYAGAFVYGRRTQKQNKFSSHRREHTRFRPQNEWIALIKNAHAGYISWEEYEENLTRLAKNCNYDHDTQRSAPREGPGLLQGIVLCGVCGKRMKVRYYHRYGQITPHYHCRGSIDSIGGKGCQSIPGHCVEKTINNLLLEIMDPMNLDVALCVAQEVEDKISRLDDLRKKHIERLNYECDLARRRFMQVDPDNRLVTVTLEKEWNEKIRVLNDACESYEQKKKSDEKRLSQEMKEKITSLATNFAQVWNDPKTPCREKKRIVHLLLEDVTLQKKEKEIVVHILFKGGKTKTLSIPRPQPIFIEQQIKPEVVREIDQLLNKYTNSKIASILNEKGYVSGTGKTFDGQRVRRVRVAYQLKSRYQRLRDSGFMTTKEICKKYQIHRATVSKFRKQGKLIGHLVDDQGRYLFEDPGSIVLGKKK